MLPPRSLAVTIMLLPGAPTGVTTAWSGACGAATVAGFAATLGAGAIFGDGAPQAVRSAVPAPAPSRSPPQRNRSRRDNSCFESVFKGSKSPGVSIVISYAEAPSSTAGAGAG